VDDRAAAKTVKRLTALQDVLGDQHDTVVTRELLRDHGMRAYLDGDNAFSYGLLHARQAAEADTLTARVPTTLAAVRTAAKKL
jgi:CHAD domain-containing protein